jgi:hypothetical protein
MIAATTGDRNLCGEVAVASDKALYNSPRRHHLATCPAFSMLMSQSA